MIKRSDELKNWLVSELEKLKVNNVVVLDVAEKSDVTDFMIVATGRSSVHCRAVAENLKLSAKQKNIVALGIEGALQGEWVLIDFSSVIVHVMQEKTRDYYQLESLWTM